MSEDTSGKTRAILLEVTSALLQQSRINTTIVSIFLSQNTINEDVLSKIQTLQDEDRELFKRIGRLLDLWKAP